MRLITTITNKLVIDNTTITHTITERREVTPIAKSVKITGKQKQQAQAKRENLEASFMRVAAIERKQAKKQNFFNKHKS